MTRLRWATKAGLLIAAAIAVDLFRTELPPQLRDQVDLYVLGSTLVLLIVSFVAGFLMLPILLKAHRTKAGESTRMRRTVEDRLDELERLKRRDMVTPEEYAAKRQEILKDL